jgi:hypothetical protein
MALIVFASIREMSFIIKNVEAIIIPTTTALIPSSDLYTAAYFFRLFQMGKKKRTNNALGRKMAMVPIKQPSNCFPVPISFNAIPPVNEAIENTGPGTARTIPIPVYISSLSI